VNPKGIHPECLGEGRRQRVAAIFFRRLCADSLWQESGERAEFALANAGGSLPILLKLRQIKSPNSGSRTPRNSQKTKNRTQLKSPKNSILQNQKSRRNRIIDRESPPISNRLAQSALCEGFGVHKRISNRFCTTNRIRCNSFKTKDRDISNRF
jgi:hypothetical protein